MSSLALMPADRGDAGIAGASANRARVSAAQVLQVATFFILGANVARVPLLALDKGTAPLGLNDVAVLATLFAGAVVMLRTRSMRLNDVAVGAMLFAAVGALSAVSAVPRFGLSAHELTVSLAYLVRWFVYFGVYLVVINCVRTRDVWRLWSALEWTMILFAAFGIVQAIFLPDFFKIVNPDVRAYVDYDPQGHRLASTVLEPNVAAAMILTVLLVQIALISAGVRVRIWKPLLLLLALGMTVSRSGALGLFVGGLVIISVRGLSRRLLKFAIPVAVLILAGLPSLLAYAAQLGKTGISDASATARLVMWARAFATFLDHPWFGIGFNTYGFVMERRGFERMTNNSSYSVEGGLLFVAVMTGIVGLAVYCGMMWFMWRRCRRTWRDPDSSPEQRGFSIGAAAATAAILVHSVFVNSLLVPFVMEPLWILWGIAFLLRRRRAVPQALVADHTAMRVVSVA